MGTCKGESAPGGAAPAHPWQGSIVTECTAQQMLTSALSKMKTFDQLFKVTVNFTLC